MAVPTRSPPRSACKWRRDLPTFPAPSTRDTGSLGGVIAEAHATGQRVTEDSLEQLRILLRTQVRLAIGMTEDPPPPCMDDRAYFPPESITRQIHADLSSMLIGGLAALLLQMLHPLAMAGVAQFSDYRTDPLGRLERTGTFVGTTTFGTTEAAEAAIARVRRIHAGVHGTTADAKPYSANDPALLRWVHAAEVSCFLAASQRYGPRAITPEEADQYVAEMARVGLALGAEWVPQSTAELRRYFATVRPELTLTPEGREARNFVLRGVGRWPHEVTTYSLLVSAAIATLPRWARHQLRLGLLPAMEPLAIRPATHLLGAVMRWVTYSPSAMEIMAPT